MNDENTEYHEPTVYATLHDVPLPSLLYTKLGSKEIQVPLLPDM
jgi:hypothetical protein